jgi:hypothetical protein
MARGIVNRGLLFVYILQINLHLSVAENPPAQQYEIAKPNTTSPKHLHRLHILAKLTIL